MINLYSRATQIREVLNLTIELTKTADYKPLLGLDKPLRRTVPDAEGYIPIDNGLCWRIPANGSLVKFIVVLQPNQKLSTWLWQEFGGDHIVRTGLLGRTVYEVHELDLDDLPDKVLELFDRYQRENNHAAN